ncbi:MAG: hypothetical protein ACI30R_00165 [Sodaliphilus sp.]
MKGYLLSMLICFATVLCYGKDNEVIITRKYTSSESKIIPQKTDQFQVQNLTLSTKEEVKEIVSAINKMVSIINEDDYEHNVFSIYVYPISPDTYTVQIEAHDPMTDTKEVRENMMGVAKIGYRYFIVHNVADLATLQSQLWEKAKGKIKFVREFELVSFKPEQTRTCLRAELTHGELKFKEMEICNVNKLDTPSEGKEAEKDYDMPVNQ